MIFAPSEISLASSAAAGRSTSSWELASSFSRVPLIPEQAKGEAAVSDEAVASV